jgi:putative glycosyltransferase (TIGR04372 family)
VAIFPVNAVAFAFLVLIRPLRRWFAVDLVIVGFHKYGHLALEPDLLLMRARSESGRGARRSVLWWSLGPRKMQSNTVLAAMWKRVLSAKPSWWIAALKRVGDRYPFLACTLRPVSLHGPMNELAAAPPHLSFTRDEEAAARLALRNYGVDPDKPWVCLIVRDSGHNSDPTGAENPDYEFRNFDVAIFEPLAEHLAGHGYQVVRMGAGREKPMTLKCDNVFDYAKSEHRSELLDVYLAAKCAFAVSTQTGPDAVCLAFRRPVCYVDVPVFSQFFLGTELATWNPCMLQKDGYVFSLAEIATSDLAWIKNTQDFIDRGISPRRSSPSEIVAMIDAFVATTVASRPADSSTEERIVAANAVIASGLGDRGRTIFGEVRARLNPHFVEANPEFFVTADTA